MTTDDSRRTGISKKPPKRFLKEWIKGIVAFVFLAATGVHQVLKAALIASVFFIIYWFPILLGSALNGGGTAPGWSIVVAFIWAPVLTLGAIAYVNMPTETELLPDSDLREVVEID